ncbi:MAG: hypothetical protein J6Q41_03585 [Firmicutes bacterium]|nr:hypothetical protein [Bacillota bacterium]
MRLEITERGPKEFYDEIMYIATNFYRFRDKPERKARSQAKTYTGYCIATVLAILVFVFEYFTDRGGIFLLLAGMMLVCLIYFIALMIGIRKRIDLMMNEPGSKIIDIDERGVRFESERQTLQIRWEELSSVIINKHSIIFMPKTEVQLMISIYTKYKEQVLQAVEAAGHMDLVVDNTAKN